MRIALFRVEWIVEGIVAIAVPASVVWGSLRLLSRPDARFRRLARIGVALGGACLGCVIGALAVMVVWRLTPGADRCSGCEVAWAFLGLAALVGGGLTGLVIGLGVGRRRIDGPTANP